MLRPLRPAALPAALAAALLAAGCASPPAAYRPPEPRLDASFVQAGEAAGEPVAEFWHRFHDDALDALVAQALAANADVKVAQARLQEARANADEAGANQKPTIGATAGAVYGRPDLAVPRDTYFSAGGTFNWELDFFGRTRGAAESAAALVQAGEAGVHAAQRLVSAEVTSNYVALRGLQQRLRVAQESLANQRETFRITEARSQLGRGTPLDVARARAQLDTTESAIPALQAAIERTLYRLATLTGQSPRAVSSALAEARLLPTLEPTDLARLPVGTPAGLLQRRPDIRAAERQLAAATSLVGVAQADLYPRISLVGLLGFSTNRIFDLFKSAGRTDSLGASLSWSAFDFGRLRARVGASQARAQAALATYEQTVQLALEETEGALAQYTRNIQQTDKLASAAGNAEEAARIARLRYEAGASDFGTVLDAERSVLQARDALVQAQTGTVTALVAVYRALGGGWGP